MVEGSEFFEMRHDAFARGRYLRKAHPPGECDWCGRERRVRYSYLWHGDGTYLRPGPPPKGRFCNFDCFHNYHD